MSVFHDDEPLPDTGTLFPHLHSNPKILPLSLDPFTITTTTGFLPLRAPQVLLSSRFNVLTKLLENLPVVRQDGSSGLLAQFQLGSVIDAGSLPDLTDALDDLSGDDSKLDLAAVTAAFRDYAFLASAYLLEPCWKTWCKDNKAGYGLGRQTLPRCIAGPLVKAATM
jgi:indoleamine 2,3-dioxygenase